MVPVEKSKPQSHTRAFSEFQRWQWGHLLSGMIYPSSEEGYFKKEIVKLPNGLHSRSMAALLALAGARCVGLHSLVLMNIYISPKTLCLALSPLLL